MRRSLRRSLIALAMAVGLVFVTASAADASILGDFWKIVQRIKQLAPPPPPAPAPPVTGGGGEIGPANPNPPANLVGHVQFNDKEGFACNIPIGPGDLADRDITLPFLGCKDNALTAFQVNNVADVFPADFAVNPPRTVDRSLGIKLTVYDSATCGATAYAYSEILLRGNAVYLDPTSFDKKIVDPFTLDEGAGVTPHGSVGGKVSCIRVHRVNRLG